LRNLSKNKLKKCEYDCDRDSDCEDGLLCADKHKKQLKKKNLDPRKADCGDVGKWNEEVCFDKTLLDGPDPGPGPAGDMEECDFDCDKDTDCKGDLLCADQHKKALKRKGFDPRKADCGDVGEWNEEVCFDPSLIA